MAQLAQLNGTNKFNMNILGILPEAQIAADSAGLASRASVGCRARVQDFVHQINDYHSAGCHPSKRHLNTTDTWDVLTGDEIAVVAVHAVVGHDIVDGGETAAVVVHVTIGGPLELLGTVEARDIAAATPQYESFEGGEVNCLVWA